MKNVVVAVSLVVAAASGAFAQTSSVALSSAIQGQIRIWLPGADLSNLTAMQYAQLVSLFATSENLRAGNDPAGQVKIILNAQ